MRLNQSEVSKYVQPVQSARKRASWRQTQERTAGAKRGKTFNHCQRRGKRATGAKRGKHVAVWNSKTQLSCISIITRPRALIYQPALGTGFLSNLMLSRA